MRPRKNQTPMRGSKQMNQKQHQACGECTKKCLRVHGNKPSSSVATPPLPQSSFFKIMIGDYKDAMFIPPKIARNFGHLFEDETCLEDSDGRRWKVGVSVLDGSLAFRRGWRDFLLDHNVSVGELVVFKCISDTLFSVQIFGTSACERLEFRQTGNGNRRKRKRDEIEISPNVLRFEENNGTSERSRGKLSKEDRMIEVVPCAISTVEITGEKSSATDVEGGLDSPNRNSSFDNSMELLVASPMNYSEGPCGTNSEDAAGVKEVGLIGPCHSEDPGIEITPKENSNFEITGEKISAKDVDDNLDSPNKDTPSDNSMRLLVASPINYSEGTYDTNNEDAMGVEEVGKISFIDSCDGQDTGILIPPKENPDFEIITGNKSSAKDVYRNTPLDNSMRLLLKSPMNYSEGTYDTNNEDAMGVEEVGKISFIDSCDGQDTGILIPPKENPDFEIITGNKSSAKDVYRNTPLDNSMRLLLKSPMNYSEGPCDMNNGDAVGVEELDKMSFIVSCDDQDTGIKIPSKENSEFEITGEKSSEKDQCRNTPLDNSMGLLVASPMNYSEGLCDVNIGDAVGVEEVGKISFIGSCDDEDTGTEILPKENSIAFLDSPGGLQIECLDKFGNDGKGNLVLGDGLFSRYPIDFVKSESSVLEQEVIDIPPISFMDPGTIERQCYPMQRLLVDENLSLQHNNLQRSQNEPAVECNESEIANQSEASWAIVTYPLTENGMSMVNCSQGQTLADNGWMIEQQLQKLHAWDLSDIQMIGSEPSTKEIIANFSSVIDENCNAYERENLFASNEAAREFRISEEETCCNSDENLMDKLEENKDATIGISHFEREDSVCPCDETLVTRNKSHVCEDSLDVCSGAIIANCTEDVKGKVMLSCESIEETRTNQKLGNVPTSGSGMIDACNVELIEGDPLAMPYASEFPKDSERNSFPTGIIPEDSAGVHKKKVDSSSQEKPFGVVKTERKEDLQSQNSASFTFSVSVNTRSWLKLPKRLPIPGKIGRKRLNRRVVMLRDPKMKVWPMLYYESPKFIGFIGGWKEFVTANNICEGEMYQLEITNEEEPTFQMRSSKV